MGQQDPDKKPSLLSRRDAIVGTLGALGGTSLLGAIGVYASKIAETYLPDPSWVEKNAVPILAALLFVSVGVAAFLGWFANRLVGEKRRLELQAAAEAQRLSEATSISRRLRDSRRVVLLITPCPDGQFYLQYLSALVRGAAQAGGANLQMHISIYSPAQAFEDDFLPEHCLSLVDEYPAPVSGVFMIPAHPESDASKAAIVAFSAKYPSTVLLDVYPGSSERSDLPPFVGGNEAEGGRLAGALAVQYLQQCSAERRTVVVLSGRDTQWERQRIDSFVAVIATSFDGIEVVVSEELDYRRDKAKHLVLSVSRNRYALGTAKEADFNKLALIYACNDEMGIGALEALEDVVRRKPGTAVPKIIGYDGTSEMLRLIEQRNPHILGTINVDVDEQARRAVGMMSALLKQQTPSLRWNLVSPKVVVNDGILG